MWEDLLFDLEDADDAVAPALALLADCEDAEVVAEDWECGWADSSACSAGVSESDPWKKRPSDIFRDRERVLPLDFDLLREDCPVGDCNSKVVDF